MKTIKRFLYYSLFIAGLLLISCEETGDEDEAPELPPESSFVMEVSDFVNNNKSLQVDTTKQNHFGVAVIQVGFWNLVLTVGMAIPVISFLESFKHEPVREDVGWWIWSYDFNAGGIKHTCELHGKVADSVTWEMYVSKTGFFEDFKWYWGRGDILGTGGYWILQESAENQVDLLQIKWERNPIDTTGSLRYMNIKDGDKEEGGYIHYGKTNDLPFDAYYHIYNKGADNLTIIEWNTDDLSGRIINPNAFWGSEDWHCWDTLQYNIECD